MQVLNLVIRITVTWLQCCLWRCDDLFSSLCLLVTVHYYRYSLCSFSSKDVQSPKRFTGLLPNTEKTALPFSPSFTVCSCHQSQTQVLSSKYWGVAIATKSPCGLGHLLSFSIFFLWRDENSRGQAVGAKLLWLQRQAESTGAPRPLSDGNVLHSSSPVDIHNSPPRPEQQGQSDCCMSKIYTLSSHSWAWAREAVTQRKNKSPLI